MPSIHYTPPINLSEWESLLTTIQGATSLPGIHGGSSQDDIHFRYGNATCHLPRHWVEGGIAIRCRSEGEDEVEVFIPDDDAFNRLLTACADTLVTGRTLEVGQGIGLQEWTWRPNYQTGDHRLHLLAPYLDPTLPNREEIHDCERWDLNPPYQRGNVWTDQQAERFVGHWLEGGDTPLIFIQEGNSVDQGYEVIDGQQRLRALLRWYRGEIAAEITDGRRFYYRDTHEQERMGMPTIKCAFTRMTLEERLRFYLRLNRGGTPHTDTEIRRVEKMLAEELGISWGALKAQSRPTNYHQLPDGDQWSIDAHLGILDWDGE